MDSALGENGWAAAVPQYYVVESAFNKDKPLLRIPTKMNGDSTDRERFNSPGFAGTLI